MLAGCACLVLAAKPVFFRQCAQEIVNLPKSAVFRTPLNMLDQAHYFVDIIRLVPGVAEIRRRRILGCAVRQQIKQALPGPRLWTDASVGTNEVEQRIKFRRYVMWLHHHPRASASNSILRRSNARVEQ
jgi:hypothetical protein